MAGYMTDADVAAMLPVCAEGTSLEQRRRALRRMMEETPPHIAKPWANVGTAKRARYVWKAKAAVWDWFWRVGEWRASESLRESAQTAPSRASGKSGGGSLIPLDRAASTASGRATPGRRRASSSQRSSAPRTSDDGGRWLTPSERLRAET